MTDRRLSPTAANAQARRATRTRFKLLRLGKRADPAAVFAGRIAGLLEAAAYDNPGEWSDSYTEFVINRFADRYVELCRVAPIPTKVRA
jgi:hypothetical protein